MANLNRIILVGRLTADPEARSTADGLAMSKFRLAVDRPQGEADFIDIIAWSRLAEVCSQYLHKGSLVLVEGRIQIRSFEDQSGQKRWSTEVVARNMQMLDKKQGQAQPEAVKASNNEEVVEDSNLELESDLPF
ncbi:MAG: single-stranded DNA-binding protein [bacterium]